MKRIIAALLAALMLFSLVACGGDDETVETGDTVSTAEAPAQTTEDTTYVYEQPDKNYSVNGESKVVRMLVRSQSLEWHQYNDGGDTSTINMAVLQRNTMVEDAFGIKFELSDMNGYFAGQKAFKTEVRTANSSGENCYDIVSPAMFGNDLIIEGIWADLASAEYLNPDKGWWLPSYTNAIKMKDKVFTITGDLSVDMLRCMTVVYFNKGMYNNVYKNDEDFANLYDVVKQGKWTWDVAFTLSKNIGTDVDEDTKYTFDSNDILGMCLSDQTTRAMPNMCGMKYIENNNGVLSTSFYNETTVTLFQKVAAVIASNEGIVLNRNHGQNARKFAKDQMYFCAGSLEDAKEIKPMTSDYGILVNPKYSEDDEYITGSAGGTIFAIPVNAGDYEMSTVVLEALGYYSYQLIRPAFFEGTLKGQTAKDAESYEMLDLIRNTLYIDFGLAFANDFDIYVDAFDKRLDDPEMTLTTWWQENGSVYGAKFDEFMSKIS